MEKPLKYLSPKSKESLNKKSPIPAKEAMELLEWERSFFKKLERKIQSFGPEVGVGLFDQPQTLETKPKELEPTPVEDDFGSKNKMLAKQEMLADQGRLYSGVDPEFMYNGFYMAGYYVEGGARSFAAYSKKMIETLGEGIKPFLKTFYVSVKEYPKFDATGMSTEEEIQAVIASWDQEQTTPEEGDAEDARTYRVDELLQHKTPLKEPKTPPKEDSDTPPSFGSNNKRFTRESDIYQDYSRNYCKICNDKLTEENHTKTKMPICDDCSATRKKLQLQKGQLIRSRRMIVDRITKAQSKLRRIDKEINACLKDKHLARLL